MNSINLVTTKPKTKLNKLITTIPINTFFHCSTFTASKLFNSAKAEPVSPAINACELLLGIENLYTIISHIITAINAENSPQKALSLSPKICYTIYSLCYCRI